MFLKAKLKARPAFYSDLINPFKSVNMCSTPIYQSVVNRKKRKQWRSLAIETVHFHLLLDSIIFFHRVSRAKKTFFLLIECGKNDYASCTKFTEKS